jgi:nitrogen regulatory protein PII
MDAIVTRQAIKAAVDTLTLNLASSACGTGDISIRRVARWTTILTKEI